MGELGDQYCEICYKEITSDDTIRCVSCDNDYHIKCIDMANVENCPMCKADLWKNEETKARYSNQSSSSSSEDPVRFEYGIIIWAFLIFSSVLVESFYSYFLLYLFLFVIILLIRGLNMDGKLIGYYIAVGVSIPIMMIFANRRFAIMFALVVISTISIILIKEGREN